MGGRQRRFWTEAEKQRIVRECEAPGSSVSMVARKYDVNANLVFTWRRDRRRRKAMSEAAFIAVDVEEPALDCGDPAATTVPVVSPGRYLPPPTRLDPQPGGGGIEIDLPCGTRVRVDADVDEAVLARVLRAVRRVS